MSDYRYTDTSRSMITDGHRHIPADPDNTDYAALLGGGIVILPFEAPPPTADDVRREASRRMQVLLGARDVAHFDMIIANATREAVRLQNIRLEGRAWSPAEAARAEELKAADAAIEAIRAASNGLEAMAPIPADYQADSYWS